MVGERVRGFVREARWGGRREDVAREQHDCELRWEAAMKNGEGRELQARGGRRRELHLSSINWAMLTQLFHLFKKKKFNRGGEFPCVPLIKWGKIS